MLSSHHQQLLKRSKPCTSQELQPYRPGAAAITSKLSCCQVRKVRWSPPSRERSSNLLGCGAKRQTEQRQKDAVSQRASPPRSNARVHNLNWLARRSSAGREMVGRRMRFNLRISIVPLLAMLDVNGNARLGTTPRGRSDRRYLGVFLYLSGTWRDRAQSVGDAIARLFIQN